MKTGKKKLSMMIGLALLAISSVCACTKSSAKPSPSDEEKPTIVLVHGAWADGSSWSKVIPILQKNGYRVIAVQNPLTSLDDDVAAVNRAFDGIKGKIVLVGHSWGGVVISAAGNNAKVKSLVYVAAFALDPNQSVEESNKAVKDRNINVPGVGVPVITDGFIRLTDEIVLSNFAQDLPKEEALVLAATQGPFGESTLKAKVADPAWKHKPNYFVVADQDRIIGTIVETEMAKKINAVTIHVPTSHVAMLASPQKVADLIIKAATDK
jgi:pimeloyl-ACP methyl ester carboxylesterase